LTAWDLPELLEAPFRRRKRQCRQNRYGLFNRFAGRARARSKSQVFVGFFRRDGGGLTGSGPGRIVFIMIGLTLIRGICCEIIS